MREFLLRLRVWWYKTVLGTRYRNQKRARREEAHRLWQGQLMACAAFHKGCLAAIIGGPQAGFRFYVDDIKPPYLVSGKHLILVTDCIFVMSAHDARCAQQDISCD